MLAQQDTTTTAVWVGITAVVGPLLTVVATQIISIIRAKHELTAKDREGALAEYRKLVATQDAKMSRMEVRLDAYREEIDKMRTAHALEVDQVRADRAECLQTNEIIMGRLKRYEEALAERGISLPHRHTDPPLPPPEVPQ